jgi:hypothetical protein
MIKVIVGIKSWKLFRENKMIKTLKRNSINLRNSSVHTSKGRANSLKITRKDSIKTFLKRKFSKSNFKDKSTNILNKKSSIKTNPSKPAEWFHPKNLPEISSKPNLAKELQDNLQTLILPSILNISKKSHKTKCSKTLMS